MTVSEAEMQAFQKWYAVKANRRRLAAFEAWWSDPIKRRLGAYDGCLDLQRSAGNKKEWADGAPMRRSR